MLGFQIETQRRSEPGHRRRRWTVLATAALLVGCVSALAACGGSGGGAAAGDGGGHKIGLALYSQTQTRWQFDARAFTAEAKKHGDTVLVQYADSDPQRQSEQVQSMISQGIDVLAIASADVKTGAALIDQAKRQDIKTIAYDIGVQGAAPDWFIVRPQAKVADLQVAAAKKAAPKGNYAIIKGDPGNDLSQATDKVYSAKLKNDPNINVVFDDWTPDFDPSTAQNHAENALTRNNDDIDAFVVTNDNMANAVVQALKGRNLAGKVFVSGLDGEQANLRLIAQGAQTMTVWTPIDEMGRLAADAAHDLAIGKKPRYDQLVDTGDGKVPTKFVKLTAVNKGNLCEFVTDIAPPGWASVANVFGSADACKQKKG